MPTGSTYGRETHPSSFRHLGRIGPSESELARFLYPIANRDVVYVFDDFIGGNNQEPTATDWNEAIWIAGNSANGTAFVPAGTQLVNGIAKGTTGAYDQDTIAMYTALVWKGDNRCGMEVRLQVDDIDNQSWEVGFNNAITDAKEPCINDIDTPSYDDGDDLALIGQQTGATLATMAFVTDGSTTSMNATKTDLGTRTMTNATYMTMRVQLDGNSSFVYIFDENYALQEHASHGAIIGSQVEGGTALQSRVLWEANTTSAINVSIDYWGIWEDRHA
jgi:hypothetical protein